MNTARNLYNAFCYTCDYLKVEKTEHALIVCVHDQCMLSFNGAEVSKRYTISSATKGLSCEADSYGTPWGLHQITEVIGIGAPKGMVFKGRKPTGLLYWEDPDNETRSLITSRIFRLKGLEPGKNQGPGVDTFERLVYLHGTNKEASLGTPSSLGCIHLGNEDAIYLSNIIPTGTLVWINPQFS